MSGEELENPTPHDPDLWTAAGLAMLGAIAWLFGLFLYQVMGAGSMHVLQNDARVDLTICGVVGTALMVAAWFVTGRPVGITLRRDRD